MNKIKATLLFFITLTFLVGCGETVPTFEENVENGIATYFKVDSISNMEIIDSLNAEEVADILIDLNEVKVINDSALIRIPIALDSSRSKLAKAETEMTNGNSLMQMLYEGLVLDWKELILADEANLKNAEELKIKNDTELEFVHLAEKGIINDIAYYLVTSKVNGEEKRVAIDPKFVVIRVFE